MVIVTCIRKFVDPAEVGQSWAFENIEHAENDLGWFFLHNFCDIAQHSAATDNH